MTVSWCSRALISLVMAAPLRADAAPPPDPAQDIRRALATRFEVGPLKIHDLGLAAVRVEGVEYEQGEKFYRVVVDYRGGTARAELAPVAGRIRLLKLKCLAAFLPDVPVTRRLLKIEPNALIIELHAQKSTLATDFGEELPLDEFFVKMHNTTVVTVRRPTEVVQTEGHLELTASDLKADRLTVAFEGEDDKLTLGAEVSFPGSSYWQYDLSRAQERNPATWIAGTLTVRNASIEIEPVQDTDLGGVVVDLRKLSIAALMLKKERGVNDIPAELQKLELCGSKVRIAHPEISGSLPQCFSIGSAKGRGRSRGEYFDVFDLDLTDVELALTGARFRDKAGTQLEVDSARLSLRSYHDKGPGEGEAPRAPKRISGTFDMSGGRVSFSGPLSAQGTIKTASLTLAGDPEKATGNGNLNLELVSLNGDVTKPIKEFIKDAPCGGTLTVGLHKAEVVDTLIALTLRDGVLNGEGRPADIKVNFSPQYSRCEWDQTVKEVSYDIPCWKNLWTVEMCRIKHRVEVHWVATLNPNPLSQFGWIKSAKFLISDGQPKVCGQLHLVPNLWLVSVSPNFNDCGQWWCNLPRDAINLLMGAWQSLLVTGVGIVVAPFGVGLC